MAGNNGGARLGAGRKPTGVKTKCYTVTLPIEEAELLEKHAVQNNLTVNKYIRELIREGGKYNNVFIPEDLALGKVPDGEVADYDTGKSD